MTSPDFHLYLPSPPPNSDLTTAPPQTISQLSFATLAPSGQCSPANPGSQAPLRTQIVTPVSCLFPRPRGLGWVEGGQLGTEGETRQSRRSGLSTVRLGQGGWAPAPGGSVALQVASGRSLSSLDLSFPIYKRTDINTHVCMTMDTHSHFSSWGFPGLGPHGERWEVF